ncbi:MAG: zinc-ribbon domain containing protein [Oscillospiraceae bacterium]|nr:zinc-ribbon domain containing protein [Oscillospiraceae bacterium]
MYTDKTFICRDCGKTFIFTAGEQEFYDKHGFGKEPLRCKACRLYKKQRQRQRRDITLYEIVCSRCGAVEEIALEPKHDRPVYCGSCYREINEKR